MLRDIFFIKLLFIRIIHSCELFTFKNICKKALFIKNIFVKRIFSLNIFIKQYIHEENIFIRRICSIFLCPDPCCHCWRMRDRIEGREGELRHRKTKRQKFLALKERLLRHFLR